MTELLAYNQNSQVTSYTNERSKTTTLSYDDASRLTGVTNANNEGESYVLNARGWKTSKTDPRGKVTSYTYTARGEPYTRTRPDGIVFTLGYNANGQISSRTNGLSQTVSYAYDDAGKCLAIDLPAGTDPGFSYDNSGRISSMVDSTGTTSWTYNNASEVTAVSMPQGSLSFAYDTAGRVTSRTETGIGSTSYGYDAASQITSLTNPYSETTSWVYDDGGRITKRTFQSGAYTNLSYDSRSRITQLQHKNSSNTVLGTESYAYSGTSRMTSKTVGPTTTTYTLDNVDRLLSESKLGYSASYTYDAAGNRLTKVLNGSTTNFAYDDGDKLTSAGSTSYSYDGEGRRTSETTGSNTTTYGYDYNNRLTGITFPNSSTNSFTYNAMGARVGRADSGGTTTYRLAGARPGSAILGDGSANYTPGISERRGGATTYYHWDVGGNLSWTSGSSQALENFKQWDWYGVTITGSGPFAGGVGFGGGEGVRTDTDTGWQNGGGGGYHQPTLGGPTIAPVVLIEGQIGHDYSNGGGGFWDDFSEGGHFVLDIIGFIDPTPLTDSINGLWFWAEGNSFEAKISLIGAFAPYAGDAAKLARMSRFADEVVDGGIDLIGRGGKAKCFAAGTRIVMADGSTKNIEDIKEGDVVLSRSDSDNPNTKPVPRKVVRTFVNRVEGTVLVRFEGGRTVETTEEHPFYVDGKGFVRAGSLIVGDAIEGLIPGVSRVLGISRISKPKTVYNFEVEGTHTYFVATGGKTLWVHNVCKLRPDTRAIGDHTTFRRNPSTGRVEHYQDWIPNPRNPSGFDSGKRFDGVGKSHGGVDTPHVHPKGRGPARLPTSQETPRGY